MKWNSKNIWVYIGAGISILLIIYCVIYVYNYYSANDILWHYPKNTKSNLEHLSPNEIGDSIGGILNPIIGLVASILTFLAFYMQKKANDDIREQFRVQQFESQFYEMLRLHKENVNEIELIKNNHIIRGRLAFHQAVLDFHSILKGITPTYTVTGGFQKQPENKVSPTQIQDTIFYQKLNYAYRIFFWNDATNPPRYTIGEDKTVNSFSVVSQLLGKTNYNWHAILGHYYRHLFQMVKFVANKTELDYKAKMSYLKIVRAQLSNYEQIMLFYNWLAEGYGSAWEEDTENGNKFFTEYKMIHNLWYSELYPENYLFREINGLIDKYNRNPKETPLFEFQGDNFENKIQVPDETKPLAENFD